LYYSYFVTVNLDLSHQGKNVEVERNGEGVTDVSLLISFQIESEEQPASYPMRIEDFIPKAKAAGQ
jgi:hypothetical protein